MPVLFADVDVLRDLAGRTSQTSGALRDKLNRCEGAVSSVQGSGWDTGAWSSAHSRLNHQIGDLDGLGRDLVTLAERVLQLTSSPWQLVAPSSATKSNMPWDWLVGALDTLRKSAGVLAADVAALLAAVAAHVVPKGPEFPISTTLDALALKEPIGGSATAVPGASGSARLEVPFGPASSQLGSAGVPGSGGENCNPAALAMGITYLAARGLTSKQVPSGGLTAIAAANRVRGGPEMNINPYKGPNGEPLGNGPTGWTDAGAVDLLNDYKLKTRSVKTLDEIKKSLDDPHHYPVLIAINTTFGSDADSSGTSAAGYAQVNPYSSKPVRNGEHPKEGGGGWLTTSHVVLITGYDSKYIYVNDPLRWKDSPKSEVAGAGFPGDWPIPIATFEAAASSNRHATPGKWYAAAIEPKVGK